MSPKNSNYFSSVLWAQRHLHWMRETRIPDFAYLSEVRKRKKNKAHTINGTSCYVCEGHIEQLVKGQRDA